MSVEIDATVTTNIDLSDQILSALGQMWQSAGFWLVISLVVAMIIMQGVKAFLKSVTPIQYRPYRRWLVFLLAYIVGFQCGTYFLTGEDANKWAVFVGFFNPVVYFTLCQYATLRRKMILLSLLKMRPLVPDQKGGFKLSDTQTFMVKRVRDE